MREPSRRTLLAGTGSVLAVAAAGCIGSTEPTDDESGPATDDAGTPTDRSTADAATMPDGLDAVLEYVYPSANDGGVALRIVDAADESDRPATPTSPEFSAFGSPEWIVHHMNVPSGGRLGLVATGSFDGSPDGDGYARDGSRGEFDVYRANGDDASERAVATDGEILLAGEPEWVTATLDSHLGDEPTYRESAAGVDALLGVVDFGGTATLIDDEEGIEEPFADLDVDTDRLPDRLLVHLERTDEEVRYTLAGWYETTPDESTAAPLETLLSDSFGADQPSREVVPEKNLVVLRANRSYTPPEERPETAGFPRYHGYEETSNEVLLRFDDGEQLPVDRFEVEIEGEVYEGEWARGQETIGEGSVVAIDADAVEPGDQISVSYDSPDGSYGSSRGTSLLRNLPFVMDFSPDERTGTLRYREGPPLDAGKVSVVVHRDDGEVGREPWSGTLKGGDSATLSDLDIEGHVAVRYERTDGESVRIGGASFAPAGRFDFEYDGETDRLTVRYPDLDAEDGNVNPRLMDRRQDQEPLPANRYEITVDGEPATRQWADVGDEIDPGATLTLEEVPVGTDVSVVWIGADGQRHQLAGTSTRPDVEFEFAYDAESREVTITHAGGQPVDASKLAIDLRGEEERSVEWGSEGRISSGDDRVVEDVSEHGYVVVTYADTDLDHVSIRRLSEETTPESASP